MSKYREIVDELQAEIDGDTRETVALMKDVVPTLCLVGDTEAPFLRALRRKAEKLGIDTTAQVLQYCAAVIDRETWKEGKPKGLLDVDNMDMTAVSEGVWEVLQDSGMKRRDICIVGRGPAVRGLAERLLIADYTVTVCHSKTVFNALAEHLDRAEIVVLGTPELPAGMTFSGAELIIDIGGAVDSAFAEACQNYLGPRDIGRLCTSILCNRAARWYL